MPKQKSEKYIFRTHARGHVRGRGMRISEFRQLLTVEASAEVETINPFENFSIDDKLDSAYIEQISTQAAISMGLAIRKTDDK